MKKINLFISLLTLLILISSKVHAQTDANIPLPEYYGIYAVVDGKLCGIGAPVAKSKCQVKTVEVNTTAGKARCMLTKRAINS